MFQDITNSGRLSSSLGNLEIPFHPQPAQLQLCGRIRLRGWGRTGKRREAETEKSIQITLMTVTSSLLWKTDTNLQDAGSPDPDGRESDLGRGPQVKETIWASHREQRQISQESFRKWERQQPQPLGANPTQGSATGSGAGSGGELVPKTLGAVQWAHHCLHHRHASQVSLAPPRTGFMRPCLEVLSRVDA